MSTLVGARGVVAIGAAGLARGVRVRWRVRLAGSPATLEWRVRAHDGHAAGEAAIIDARGERRLLWFTHDGEGAWCAEGNLEHLDLPGLLSLSVSRDGEPRVLYARTPLPAMLGVEGGCWEIEGAAWE